ncbi:intermembrane lipid transfer protein VPS13A-like [Marmota flaviventris]
MGLPRSARGASRSPRRRQGPRRATGLAAQRLSWDRRGEGRPAPQPEPAPAPPRGAPRPRAGGFQLRGDVALKNLEVKENALSQLDVPFKVKVGHIGNLKLRIPWKNLYTQPFEAVLEDIYLLIVPSSRIKYDPLKEEKQLLEAKQQELKRIEETKQKVVDQGKKTKQT